MPEEEKAIDYSWRWITASQMLSSTACELCTLIATPDGNNAVVSIYDGENASGTLMAELRILANRSVPFTIHHHAYCRRGLYIVLDAHVDGVFVQWKPLPTRRG